MAEKDSWEKFIEIWRKRIQLALDRRNRTPFIVGVAATGVIWVVNDGRLLSYLDDATRISCFSVADYPAGEWDYTTLVLNGFKPFEFKNYLLMQNRKEGRISSDTCAASHGKWQVISGDFVKYGVLDTTYRDGCDRFCSKGSYEVSEDGCELKGSASGYHTCPDSFPNVNVDFATQQTETVFRWRTQRPFFWEVWKY